jgi:hypothetical protein
LNIADGVGGGDKRATVIFGELHRAGYLRALRQRSSAGMLRDEARTGPTSSQENVPDKLSNLAAVVSPFKRSLSSFADWLFSAVG